MENEMDTNKIQPPAHTPAAADSQQETAKEYLLFNVMPQAKNGGQVVDPTMKILTPEPAELKKKTVINPKIKLYGIIGVVVLIAGGLSYFFVMKYLSKPKTENILIQNGKTGSKNGGNPSSGGPVVVTTSKEWQQKYFNSPVCTNASVCGDDADPDNDGLTNAEEFKAKTDPNNRDSDGDGLADGDEIHIFGTDPLNAHTAGDQKYTDADFFLGGYDVKHPNQKYTTQQIADITAKMKQFKLHEPTVTTLSKVLISVYNFTNTPAASSTPSAASSTPASTGTASSSPVSYDDSPAAKQDRDAQRSNAIKNIGIALMRYYDDQKSFPSTTDFSDMVGKIKVYNRVATRYQDPLNQDPYLYSYTSDGKDFTLSFYSETQAQVLKKHMADAIKDKTEDEASLYDDQRKNDLESLRLALLVYSNKNIAGTQEYVFPSAEKYKTVLVPDYMQEIPKDPQTKKDYEYKVSDTFDTFTLKVILSSPPSGSTGYLCNQEECRYY